MNTPLVKISDGNSKLGKIPNVSLLPVRDCGNCVCCRKSCYAVKFLMYPSVKANWTLNSQTARKRPARYFADIRAYLAKKQPRFFRWHIAGDILNQAYLGQMAAIASDFPSTRFLAFTKMHSLNFAGLPANLSIVLSRWPGDDVANPEDLPQAWMQDGTETRVPEDAIECPGTCDSCGMCFQLGSLGRDVVFHKH